MTPTHTLHRTVAMHEMKSVTIVAVLLFVFSVSALDRIEARAGRTSVSGHMTGAIDFQFGVQARGTLDQKIEQLERELRLLRFSKDELPELTAEISYAGTNRFMSQCLADLSKAIGKRIPMDLRSNDFTAKEFVFEKIPLVDALKYLVAFDAAILNVCGRQLVCKPVRQALDLDETAYQLLRLMKMQRFKEAGEVLAAGAFNVDKIKDQDGRTLLHFAAWKNQTAIAARLIVRGANVNAQDNAGYTPLYEAVRNGNRECAEILLTNGADTSLADNNNSTALQTAIYYGFLDIAKMLAAHGAAVDIFTASGLGMTGQVEKMLDDGVDYRKLQREYISKLLAAGPNLSSIGDPLRKSPGSYLGIFNVSPLHWAARGGSVEVASLLISRGELVSLKDSNEETPLFWAAANGKVRAAELLIKKGADVNARNAFSDTPLLTSARGSVAPGLIKLLIEAGAGVNATDSQGENALHKLARFGYPQKNVEAAQMLLDAGADIAARNRDGKTPLDLLLGNSMRNSDLVELYRKYTAKAASKRIK
jgi:ankyrin repeat protein